MFSTPDEIGTSETISGILRRRGKNTNHGKGKMGEGTVGKKKVG